MSNYSPINDFDAYKHEWDKGYSFNNFDKTNKFSLNNDDSNNINFSKYFRNFFSSSVPFTKIVIGICVAIYVLSFIFPKFVYSLGYFPPVLSYNPWTIITSGFTHLAFFHIFFNLFTLYFIANELEKIFGSLVYAFIYIFSILGGSALTGVGTYIGLVDFYTFTIGASGGIFGLFGAIFVLHKKQSTPVTPIVVFLIINIIIGLTVPNISLIGHIGGFIFGLISTYFVVKYREKKYLYFYKVPALSFSFLFLVLIFLSFLPCFK